MNNNQDKELVQLIKNVVAGKSEKKELCNRIYKEVYALSYPVYRDEEKSMTQTKKALIEVCSQVANINLAKNIHKQIATIVSVYFLIDAVREYEDDLKSGSDIKEYNYSRIREDEELLEYMKKKANAFRSPKVFDEQEEEFRTLNSIHMALIELYAYEMHSVDAIERMTEIDSTYIGNWIEEVRSIVLGYELQQSENEADDTTTASAVIANTGLYEKENDKEAKNDTEEDGIVEDDIEEDGIELEEDTDSEEYEDNNEYEEQRAVSSVYRGGNGYRENAVTMFLRRLFPALSFPVRRAISWAMGCVVVIAFMSILFVSVLAGKNKKKVSKDYDYQSMQYYTTKQPTTKQQSTTAGNAQTTQTQTTETQTEITSTQNNTTEKQNNRNNNENMTEEVTQDKKEEQSTTEGDSTTGEEDSTKEEPAEGEDSTKEEPTTEGEDSTKEEPTTEGEDSTKEEPTTEGEDSTKEEPTTEKQGEANRQVIESNQG